MCCEDFSGINLHFSLVSNLWEKGLTGFGISILFAFLFFIFLEMTVFKVEVFLTPFKTTLLTSSSNGVKLYLTVEGLILPGFFRCFFFTFKAGSTLFLCPC